MTCSHLGTQQLDYANKLLCCTSCGELLDPYDSLNMLCEQQISPFKTIATDLSVLIEKRRKELRELDSYLKQLKADIRQYNQERTELAIQAHEAKKTREITNKLLGTQL